ncbi:uncharacterized protein LOC115710556 [Cannabis sativa]|uniref:uncharacterized protein LOC115710556 n=1 Tax=Cannabis sativa TaxID=3483 RepID=UPI0029CA6369|nr:uncharacterized protein LOC115710556 [Cannabis sativa]
MDPTRYQSLKEEVDRLLACGFIRESFYPNWLANPVLVPKPNGSWRTCVDFTDLNKACLKDSFPLPSINQLVDATAGHELLSFMDAYSGYRRISIYEPDQEHTSFITDRGNKKFQWTEKCEEAFQALKSHWGQPPILSKPMSGEILFIYLAVSENVISSMKKLAFALVIASRKLGPYFQAHSIEVLTNYPLRQVLVKPEASGRLLKWSVELSQFYIRYKPKSTIKGRALADFILEFPSTEIALIEEKIDPNILDGEGWTLYVDGASNSKGSGGGIILISPSNFKVHAALRFEFSASNNEVEYEALIERLKLTFEMKIEHLQAFCDSQIIECQVNEEYLARGRCLARYLALTCELLQKFKKVIVSRVPRAHNSHSDALARLASTREAELLDVIHVDVLTHPTVSQIEVMEVNTAREVTWMTPIMDYLEKEILPEDKIEARKLRYPAAWYVIYDGRLYRRSFSQPLLKCIDGAECDYILHEVRGGICDNHAGGNSLSLKIMRQGYYWPTLRVDASNFAKKCEKF